MIYDDLEPEKQKCPQVKHAYQINNASISDLIHYLC